MLVETYVYVKFFSVAYAISYNIQQVSVIKSFSTFFCLCIIGKNKLASMPAGGAVAASGATAAAAPAAGGSPAKGNQHFKKIKKK